MSQAQKSEQTTRPLENPVDVSQSKSAHSLRNKLGRTVWNIVWLLLFRPTPKVLYGWRRFLLRMFGAEIGRGAIVKPSVRVWAPWNLTIGDYSCLSFDVDCYCVAPIHIGAQATVSQYSFLCTASHDYSHPQMPLVIAPIVIGDGAWVCADVFVGPDVTIGKGAVVGARASVFRDVDAYAVVAGNPATFIKKREMQRAGD